MAQLSTLELVERKTSVLLNIPEDVIAAVIRHKWKSVNEATYLHSTIEDSGLGKFSSRTNKILKRIEYIDEMVENCSKKVLNPDLTEGEIKRYNDIIHDSLIEKEYLQTKI